MLDPIRSHGYDVVVADLSRPSAAHVRVLLQSVEVVLIDVSMATREILATIHDLSASIGVCDVAPRLLCFSSAHRNSQFVLAIEKCGVRYVRISDSAMLLEAIDLLRTEMDELRRNGPCFHILHRFAGKICAPGEEISAVLFPRATARPQLPLALSERLVFDFLAQHRGVAFDSRQIASGLRGGWFYRDHAANSGVLQVVKVRVPAVKVIVQRIREAMATVFEEARVKIDPLNVLQSWPAAGSNRVLYKLAAEIKFRHSAD